MRSARNTCLVYALRFGLVAAGLGIAPIAHAQYAEPAPNFPQSQQRTNPSLHDPMKDADSMAPPNAVNNPELRAKLLNEDRHKKLLADSKHLLELAQALNEEVQKTSKDELNVDVVKKAAEMEKLARDLKDRMRY